MKTFKNLFIVILTGGAFLLLTIINLFAPKDTYSYSERRALAKRPSVTAEDLFSGQYMNEFESYATDAFPFRDTFRSLKASFSRNVLLQEDNNGYFLTNGYLSRLDYRLNEEKWESSVSVIRRIYETMLRNTNCRFFFSMVPDKNLYLEPYNHYPVLDYKALKESLQEELPFAEFIDIEGTIFLESFYRTDQHWKQETLLSTAQALAEGMGSELPVQSDSYTVNTLELPFYGTFSGQSALKIPPDTIRYLTSEILDAAEVISYDSGKPAPAPLYNLEKAKGPDAYDLFLSGPDAFLTIENPCDTSGKELVIFRDSFGSSIAPLLVPGYAKITLIDLRYIRSDQLENFITFDRQDVLFLYSALILNSGVIR